MDETACSEKSRHLIGARTGNQHFGVTDMKGNTIPGFGQLRFGNGYCSVIWARQPGNETPEAEVAVTGKNTDLDPGGRL